MCCIDAHFRMPDHLDLSPCFVDYLNFRCWDGRVLQTLLQRPVNFAINEMEAFAEVLVSLAKDRLALNAKKYLPPYLVSRSLRQLYIIS